MTKRVPLHPKDLNLRLLGNINSFKNSRSQSETRLSMSLSENMAANAENLFPPSAMNSPVTNLAMNLSGLSTATDHKLPWNNPDPVTTPTEPVAHPKRSTPKRRLSLSSVDTPPSDDSSRDTALSTGSSIESGVFVDSPGALLDSPTMEGYAQQYRPNIPLEAFTKKKTIAFRTAYNSQPMPTLRLDCDSPTDFMEADKGCYSGSVAFELGGASLGDSKSAVSGYFSLEEGSCQSQDSGVGLQDFKKPGPRMYRRKSRLNEISEETCSPHKYSPVKSSPMKRSFSFLDSFKEAGCSAGNTDADSPIRMKRSTLHTSDGYDSDDGFLDLMDQEVSQISDNVSESMAGLFTGQILSNPPAPTSAAPSNQDTTPVLRRFLPAKRFLRRSQSVDIQPRSLNFNFNKRCDPPDALANENKRWKSALTRDDSCAGTFNKNPARRLHRCHSETEAMIKSAVHRMTVEPHLIADCSKPYVLPVLEDGKHADLKSITPETLSRLVEGEFADEVEEFHIVDCRYPYEFDGGHIQDALNIYTREEIVEQYMSRPRKLSDPNKRFVIVFHCEFSSERGPNLYRFLRSQDRESNKECYPALHYPEMYLLEGGYKAFFERHQHQCCPQTYTQMMHKDFSDDLRKFRAKSKSWAGEKASGSRPGLRAGLKF